MQHLVAYDVADDRRRNRVARILLDFGHRLQESLFWCDLEADHKQRLLRRLSAAIDPAYDKVHVVPLCGQCWLKIECLGLATKAEDAPYYVL